jgi:hypothetical protein
MIHDGMTLTGLRMGYPFNVSVLLPQELICMVMNLNTFFPCRSNSKMTSRKSWWRVAYLEELVVS